MDGDHPLCGSPYAKSLPQPIGRPERAERPPSTLENFQRAPGAEVKSRSFEEDSQVSLPSDGCVLATRVTMKFFFFHLDVSVAADRE